MFPRRGYRWNVATIRPNARIPRTNPFADIPSMGSEMFRPYSNTLFTATSCDRQEEDVGNERSKRKSGEISGRGGGQERTQLFFNQNPQLQRRVIRDVRPNHAPADQLGADPFNRDAPREKPQLAKSGISPSTFHASASRGCIMPPHVVRVRPAMIQKIGIFTVGEVEMLAIEC